MSKPELIKKSGWAFIASAFAFMTIMSNSDAIQIPGSEISAILLAVGLLGLRACYGEKIGALGRNILQIGVVATVLFYIGLVALGLLYASGTLPEAQIEEGVWILLFGGPTVALLALTLFGLATFSRKPMARSNWLPAVAGIWYPVFYFFLAGYLFTHDGVYPSQYQIAFTIMHLMQFSALCALGAVLVSDSSGQMATA